MDPVEEIHRLADDDRVYEHGNADGLPEQNVDQKDRHRNGDGGRPVEDAKGL